ncbi:MAG TPA: papain-like cysteine protease family protein [Pseudacidobacterium sp.]|jgi:hypothetical protein|nr:papain-like cysteine protease family protein [Pseudacidobacterium sp.]
MLGNPVVQPPAEAHLNVPFIRQQGHTCWLITATMVRSYHNQMTFANPSLQGFGSNGLDIHEEGRFDAYLRSYSIAIKENNIQSVAQLAQILLQQGPVWAMTPSGDHCIVITGAFKKLGVDWTTCNDSGRNDGAGRLMYFADFQKHPIIGIYSPNAFSGQPTDEHYGEWV